MNPTARIHSITADATFAAQYTSQRTQAEVSAEAALPQTAGSHAGHP
jgi:hypothetical protein